MVVRLHLSRLGCKNKPFCRVMAAYRRSPRDGKHLEVLGYYNPLPEGKEKVKHDDKKEGNKKEVKKETGLGLSLDLY